MKFKTIQEAFNHYRTATIEEIERRAAEIKGTIETDPNADIMSLNIEISGLQEAKANLQDKGTAGAGKADSGNDAPEKRAFNPVTGMTFQNSTPKDEDIFSSREYRSAFFKTMLNQTLSGEETAAFTRANAIMATEKRAAFINTTEAAAVIPTQMLNEIYKKAADMGGVLALCRRFNIPANLAVPVATPEDAAQWHVEGDEVTPDNKKPTNVMFNGYELMKVFSISAAARSMSISAYESYLQEELSRVIITALQKAAIDGTGTGEPLGLLATGAITWGATNSIVAANREYVTFTKAAALLKRGYSMGAVWAMNNTTLYNGVMGIVDTTGKPLFNEARDGNADRILGKPIVIDDFIPDNTILLGNFQYYGMNYPQDILLEVSRDSSFRKGLIDYRAMAVADGKPIIGDAFVKVVLKA